MPFMKMGLSRRVFFLSVALFNSGGLLLPAATHYVTVDGAGFSPATLPIEVGDTVVWENVDESDFPHTTTSTLSLLDPDYWNGPLFSLGDTFSQTFNNAGTFNYTDQLDAGSGVIAVSPAVVSPVINLEAPRMEGGQFIFAATGLTVGKTNVLQSSTDLATWLPVSTNTVTGAAVTFTNASGFGQCFYRVVELP